MFTLDDTALNVRFGLKAVIRCRAAPVSWLNDRFADIAAIREERGTARNEVSLPCR